MYIYPETDSPVGLWILAPLGSQEALFHLLSLVFQGDLVAQVTHFHPSRNTSKSSVKRIHSSKTSGGGTRAVKKKFHEVSGWQRKQRDKFSIHGSSMKVPTFLQVDHKLREVKHHIWVLHLHIALGCGPRLDREGG